LSAAHRPMASVSAREYTAPVGFCGDANNRALVRSVRAASSWSTVARKPVDSSVVTATGTPLARRMVSGYVTQYGAVRRTSSPGSMRVAKVAGMVIGRFASSSLLIPRSTVKRMTTPVPNIDLPAELRPGDGRFGSGPSKVRPEAVTALAAAAPSYLGTSHRQAAVKSVVRRL